MMKGFKKMVSVLLAAVMCAGMCLTGFAADTDSGFSITVENSVVNKTYSAYKIFDALYNGDAVTYSVDADSPWYGALKDGEVFDFTSYTKEDQTEAYYVTVKEGVEDSAVIAAIEAAFASIGEDNLSASVTGTGNGDELVLDPGEAGYYYVTTTTGSTVSINTAAPDATIIDKNTAPSELHKYITDEEGNTYDAVEDGMGDEVTFDITAYVPLYDGDKVVTKYVFTDELSNGLLIELTDDQFTTKTTTDGTIYVLIEDVINEWVTLGDGTSDFTNQVYDYTFELTGYDTYTDDVTGETVHTFTGFILTFYTYDTDAYVKDDKDTFDTSKYPANADIEITYTASVSSLEGYDNTNDIKMEWEVTSWNEPTPEDSTPGDGSGQTDHNDVYSWELELVKVDGTDQTIPLEGATFTLESENMQSVVVGHSYAYVLVSEMTGENVTIDGIEYKVVDFETTDYYKQDDETFGLTETGDGPYHRILTDKTTTVTDESSHLAQGTTDASGKLYFGGLGSGDYTLTEIVAPDGYNILSDPINFTISWDEDTGFSVTMTANGVTSKMSDGYVLTLTVENNAGTLLPGTGGMGTTIFYIAGVALIICAAAALIAKRRLDRQN